MFFLLLCFQSSPVIPTDLSAEVTPPGPIVNGSIVTFRCEAMSGDLPISYSWTGPANQDVSLTDTDGTISATLSEYGFYTCTATNEFGMATTKVDLIQAGM